MPAIGMLLAASTGAICTGTVIAPRLVLTAGHCAQAFGNRSVMFRIDDADGSSRQIKVASLEAYPGMVLPEKGADHDIGLAYLKSEALVEPVPLARQLDASSPGQSVWLVGYGLLDEPSNSGAGQKHVSRQVLTELRETTIFTRTRSGNLCDGDSGGPLLIEEGDGLAVAGVASYGDARCAAYSVHTRVDAYATFIGLGPDDASPPCPGLSEVGLCRGDSLVRCENEQVVTRDCQSLAKRCAWDDTSGRHDCI